MFRLEHNAPRRRRSLSLDRATDEAVVKKHRQDNTRDVVPQIHLTHWALAEHDHCNHQRQLRPQPRGVTTPPLRRSARLRQVRPKHIPSDSVLRRFARHGGPDLTSLRGCPNPTTMSKRTSRPSKRSTSSRSSKRSSPYDANYKMRLAQAGVFLTVEKDENDKPIMPANYDDIMTRLSRPRDSLSPNHFTEQDFLRFQEEYEQEILEPEIMRKSMATIEGKKRPKNCRIGGTFNNIEPFDSEIAMAVPDEWHAAPTKSLDQVVLQTLNREVAPSSDWSRGVVPNFFLEGKSSEGRADVAKRQAVCNGAIGARGMISLQNFPNDILQYDGNAYTFTSTYHDATLKIYAMHGTAPKISNSDPTFHPTPLNAFAMDGNITVWRQGATFYRNSIELAEEWRDSFIARANQAAQRMLLGEHSSHVSTVTNEVTSTHRDSQSQEYTQCPDTDTSADELSLEPSSKRSRTNDAPAPRSIDVSGSVRQTPAPGLSKRQF